MIVCCNSLISPSQQFHSLQTLRQFTSVPAKFLDVIFVNLTKVEVSLNKV